jgi:PAS domain S-box-containing protein
MTTTSKRVLVVEDEAIVAQHIKIILDKHNYEILTHASSGKEAIKKAAELQPDIILMDIHLKGDMDGVQTAEFILSQQDVPIIYLTGNADSATIDRAKITHPYAYLLKPFKPIELLTAIEIAFFKHQSEKELRENRLLLETTLKGISDAVIAIDSKGNVIFINPVAEQLTGWPKEEAIGANIAEVLKIASGGNRNFVADPLAWLKKFKEAGKLPEVNILASKAGDEYFIEYDASFNENVKGKTTGAVITFRDITVKYKATIALQESEARFRSMADTAPVMVWQSDENGNYTYFNKPWLEFRGRKLEEELGDGWIDGLHPDDLEYYKQVMAGMYAGKESFRFEYRLRRYDGAYRWIINTGKPHLTADGSFIGYIGTCLDISDRKIIEENLLKSNREITKLALVASKTDNGVIITDAAGRIEWINDGFTRMSGYRLDEITGKKFGDFLQGEDSDPLTIQFMHDQLSQKEGFKAELINYRKSGKPYWVSLDVQPVHDPEGGIVSFFAIMRDVTARKEAEGRLLEMEKQKQAQEKEMHRVSTLSLLKGQEKERQRISRDIHDSLGQILTALRLNIQTLSVKDGDADDLGQEKIPMIKDLLTEAILEARRISYDLMPALLSDFGLAAAARQLVEQVSISSGINIHLEHNLDNDRLEQSIEISMYRILQEALNNSVKYSGAESIWINMQLSQHNLELEVRDNGIGIDPEKVDSRPNLKEGGRGIYNMQERASLLGGKFELSAQPEKGCRIIVNIPLKYS